jgi:hypothetical protein
LRDTLTQKLKRLSGVLSLGGSTGSYPTMNRSQVPSATQMADRDAALEGLGFGRVDSESEPDLDRRFLRTDDFERFLDPANLLLSSLMG